MDAHPSALNRRSFLSLAALGAGAVLGSPLLAACGGQQRPAAAGGGLTPRDKLQQVLPSYVPGSLVKPDIPSVTAATGAVTDPVFFKYPDNPVATVSGVPGKGGTYTTMTPLWGAIPPTDGNSYIDAVNKALGVNFTMHITDATSYAQVLAPLFAADKLPDWIMIPGWETGKLNFGSAVAKFTDLGPYLSGDKIKAYPNLAAIPTGAWAAGVWNGKLYGIPISPGGAIIAGTIFYRKDIFDEKGISADGIRTPADLMGLGKELTDEKAGRWAFDDIFGGGAAYLGQVFGVRPEWGLDGSGKLIHKYEQPQMVEALNWFVSLVKAGYVHPDAVAGNSGDSKQRFWSGKVAIQADGMGAWLGDDITSGKAANPSYNRQAFKLLSPDANTTPSVPLGNAAAMFSYLNAKLSPDQVKELLAVANYLAAPYGSKEFLTANFGAQGVTYTMKDGTPTLTEKGGKEVAASYIFLVGSPPYSSGGGGELNQLAKEKAAWQADMVKYAYKPLFYGMNIVDPPQYASIGQAVEDTLTDVRLGRKPISAYQEAVADWRRNGGDKLRAFREDIRAKYGDGTK
ncbi:hypothetical protein [Nonomuraea sp. NPDC050786]|uniref:hypothetical protein n=1 Tax=Nonomuraea sp. NPDC050786 TaxID=3154840 RepID=UPI0033DF3A10